MYTVKQIANLAGVSVRTMHYYDEIDLLKPSAVGDNGYRYYSDEALFQLQQILLYREMELDLAQIKAIMDDEAFDLVSALQQHRQILQRKMERLRTLVKTVDATILHLTGEVKMSDKNVFVGFSEEKQQAYAKEAEEMWGDTVRQSMKLWHSYSEERKAEIMQEGSDIYSELAAKMALGPEHPDIQALLERWHEHMRYFYEPSLETLRGLGEAYDDHPDFRATFTAVHPDLPAFLKKAIR
ncbi:MAG: MerR family transcriptional regulator, partial [Ardenticatenaceae bacterium]|nr:MerR family transcriptional regulator [Ardenticatenaceae bacterium]